jgi:uncharacterized RDD family membrane protein YckC
MTPALAIDTQRRVATPEGCEIGLRIAGPVTRARAWLYDALIRMFFWFLLGMLASFIGRFGMGLFFVSVFLLEWFYPVVFEVYRHGQTPGKRACGLMVLHDDGRPVGFGASFVRNSVRFVDFLPVLYATGFVASLLNADGKRLGDLAAGTVVVHVDVVKAPALNERAVEELGAQRPPFPLTVEEQQALIEYRARVGQFTEERSLELAELPAPLTGDVRPEEARRRLLRMANFLIGQR